MFIPSSQPQPSATTGEQPNRCYLPVSNGQLLCSDDVPWGPLDASLWRFSNPQLDAPQFYLGDYRGQHCYVVALRDLPDVHGHHWQGLRNLLGLLDEAHYEMAARALQVVNWDRDHRFCGRCGAPTESHEEERAKVCQPCGLQFYPRLSPCVITVITRDDHCLLAHNPAFPARFFSALAGFIEAGETIEAALRREVFEEVGLNVGRLHYFGSQAWPFPGQLMIGFHAEYESGDIAIDGIEIEEANWYRYDQLPLVPPPSTLSGQLIQAFVQRHQSG